MPVMKSIFDFKAMKQKAEKIAMLTCYDSWSYKALEASEIDMILVGDSVAMVVHGYKDTLSATTEMMCMHCSAVRRGAASSFVVVDVPFLDFRKDLNHAVEVARQLMVSGANSIKVEGAAGNLEKIHHLVESGVPVVGHLGLTPQSHHQLGGFKVQAREAGQQVALKTQALELQQAGCFALVLECVPSGLAKEVSEQLEIPVIGIGSGSACDGQVLVLQDMLGANQDFQPKFVRKYDQFAQLIQQAANSFCSDVKNGDFPGEREMYL
jgi:3-methyl-2-oxobutanoate hydroxymethyltransferase